MDVDEAQRDTLSSGVDGFRGLRRRNVRRNRGDLAVLDRDIANGVNVVPRPVRKLGRGRITRESAHSTQSQAALGPGTRPVSMGA